MAGGRLTPEQQNKLRENRYVRSVTEYRIYYTDAFREYFIHEYINGRSPSDIFRDAGIEPELLGRKRIERAAARWREQYDIREIGEPMAELRRKDKQEKRKDTVKECRELIREMSRELDEKSAKLEEIRSQRDRYIEQIKILRQENENLKK